MHQAGSKECFAMCQILLHQRRTSSMEAFRDLMNWSKLGCMQAVRSTVCYATVLDETSSLVSSSLS